MPDQKLAWSGGPTPRARARDTLHPLPPLRAEIVNPIGRIAGEEEVEEEDHHGHQWRLEENSSRRLAHR